MNTTRAKAGETPEGITHCEHSENERSESGDVESEPSRIYPVRRNVAGA
jgi:hypothetical protein